MDIKSLTIVFENVDSVEIDGKYVEYLEIDGYNRVVRPDRANKILHFFVCLDHLVIGLNADANKLCYPFDIQDIEPYKVFDRIERYRDIAYIEIKYTDDTAAAYYVAWDESSEDINKYQTMNIDNKGTMCIVIDRKQTVENYMGGKI